MNARTEYSATGGFRFIHDAQLPIGQYFMHHGEKVKLIGPGMAGMPEVEMADGFSFYAMPHDLKPCEETAEAKK